MHGVLKALAKTSQVGDMHISMIIGVKPYMRTLQYDLQHMSHLL